MKTILKKIWNWIATDGLLHILMCAVISLAVLNLTDILWLSMVAGIIPALAKEYYDVFVEEDNNFSQAMHDLICDGIGLAITLTINIF